MSTTISFWVDGPAAGYSRDAARQRRTPPEQAQFRLAVVTDYRIARRTNPAYAHLVEDGSYTGQVKLLVEAYGAGEDWDNLGKEVSDALQRIAYRDDRQVFPGTVDFPERILTPKGGIKRALGPTPQGVRVTLTFIDL